jgi:hypothetical protein
MGLLLSLLAEVFLLLGCISFFGIGAAESIEITTKSRDPAAHPTHFKGAGLR